MITNKVRSQGILKQISPHLEMVEAAILEQATAFDPAVAGYISYLLDTGGKRIRPNLAILAGGAVAGEPTKEHRRLGLVLELIHIATLVHDDIMDGALMRRQMPTASAKWGQSLAVLLGDALFAHALQLTADFEDAAVSKLITQASKDVCTGEIIQTQRRFDLNLGKADYFHIIELKTGALFAAATEAASRLSSDDPALAANLRDYGMKLGTAYQIYDDSLDLLGDEADVGKTLGTDLEKGKLTLPVIYLIENATETQKTKLNKLIINREPLDAGILAGIADYEGAIERSLQEARTLLHEAAQCLTGLPESDYREGLLEISTYVGSLVDGCQVSSY
jgi:octaprenyl-diphosphate synthase